MWFLYCWFAYCAYCLLKLFDYSEPVYCLFLLMCFVCICHAQVTNYDTVSKCLCWVEENIPLRMPDESKIRSELRVTHELEDEEEETGSSFNTEFWFETKKQLLIILELMSEVQSVKCYCQRPDCPFQATGDCSAPPSNHASPRTSPTVYRKDVSYGGFESMMKSQDVVYGSTSDLDVKEKPDPLSLSAGSVLFKRGTPVVRRKRITAPSVFNTDQIANMQNIQNRMARVRLLSTVH